MVHMILVAALMLSCFVIGEYNEIWKDDLGMYI